MVWSEPWTTIRHEPHLAANLFEIPPCHYYLKCLFLKYVSVLFWFGLFFDRVALET